MIKKQIFPVLLGSLMLLIALSACTDERTRPDVPIEPSYNETQFLLDKAISNGEDVTQLLIFAMAWLMGDYLSIALLILMKIWIN